MTSRLFLYVALIVFATVVAAFGYRLHKDGQCCAPLAPIADGDRRSPALAEDRPADSLPSTRSAAVTLPQGEVAPLPAGATDPHSGDQP